MAVRQTQLSKEILSNILNILCICLHTYKDLKNDQITISNLISQSNNKAGRNVCSVALSFEISAVFLIQALYVALSVTSITLMEIGILPNAAMLLLLSRVLFLAVTMAYYYHLGRKPKKIWADCVRLTWGLGEYYLTGAWGMTIRPSCCHHWDLACCNPPHTHQYSTDKHSVTLQTV